MAIAPLLDESTVAIMAIPVGGGPPVRICQDYCRVAWSIDGRYLLVSVDGPSIANAGRSLAIPIGPNETLPAFPPLGIPPHAEPAVMPGARSIPAAFPVPGPDPDTFAYVQSGVHRNLFRIAVPCNCEPEQR